MKIVNVDNGRKVTRSNKRLNWETRAGRHVKHTTIKWIETIIIKNIIADQKKGYGYKKTNIYGGNTEVKIRSKVYEWVSYFSNSRS